MARLFEYRLNTGGTNLLANDSTLNQSAEAQSLGCLKMSKPTRLVAWLASLAMFS
jgi:hypothetical protein